MAKDLEVSGGLKGRHRDAIKAACEEHKQTTDPERREQLVNIIRSTIMDSAKGRLKMLKYEGSKVQAEDEKMQLVLNRKQKRQNSRKELIQAAKEDPAMKQKVNDNEMPTSIATSGISSVILPAKSPQPSSSKQPTVQAHVGRIKPQIAVKKKKESKIKASTTKTLAKPSVITSKTPNGSSITGKEGSWLSLPPQTSEEEKSSSSLLNDLAEDVTTPPSIMLEVNELQRLGEETRQEVQRLYALGSREAQEAADRMIKQQRERESELKASVNCKLSSALKSQSFPSISLPWPQLPPSITG